MIRLRRLAARLHRAVPDATVGLGIVLLAVGFGLAWIPSGFIVAGLALIVVVRYGSEG